LISFSFEAGDYVLHIRHGVGRFLGIEQMQIGKRNYEMGKIQYANSSSIFVPIYHFGLLQFHSKEASNTLIEALGKSKVLKKKEKLRGEIKEIADALLKIAAQRALVKVEKFPVPSNYADFDKEFEHELTYSQKKALDEIFIDLNSSKPMDRILCADVGFGKTEVAFRAAFLPLMAFKSVIFIVPTTLLATEHFKTAKSRFEKHGINVGLLSRLVHASEAEKTKKDWFEGKVNLLITTASHKGIEKLLHDNIGLVILDEEHHFGVKFKEDIRKQGNILQLSATPIPRTLNLALSKVKEISTLDMPPVNRKKITLALIKESKMDLIINIKTELDAGGRVFLVVPRIEDIPYIENFIKGMDYLIIHGRLSGDEVEKRMLAFRSGEKPILIATNIIESGLNVLEANLMYIFNAHTLGVSQIHQLKGRVGRSGKDAKVFLVAPANISDIAKERLEMILKHDFLGAGFSLALNDMELRGAGSVLGYQQSGKDYGFGIEAYYSMLALAMGDEAAGDAEEIHLDGFEDGYIPQSFVAHERERISFYKKLSSVISKAQIEDLTKQLESYGEIPAPVQSLLDCAYILMLARGKGIKKITKYNNEVKILFEKIDLRVMEKIIHLKPSVAGNLISIKGNVLEVLLVLTKQ
jgi:transcription-repair coupling factor (superfamily II helicase)